MHQNAFGGGIPVVVLQNLQSLLRRRWLH